MDELFSIVSQYTKIPVDQLQPTTRIDRTAVASSIVLHRMYAALGAAGFVITDYTAISTLAQLQAATGKSLQEKVPAQDLPAPGFKAIPQPSGTSGSNVGIDIESIDQLPLTDDYREHSFYTMHFAPAEMAYCILQPDPYGSFAGLFAAKEAIIKADSSFAKTPFNNIIIDHSSTGRPLYPGFHLSISHTDHLAVAVAVKIPPTEVNPSVVTPQKQNNQSPLAILLALFALVVSVIALLVILFRR